MTLNAGHAKRLADSTATFFADLIMIDLVGYKQEVERLMNDKEDPMTEQGMKNGEWALTLIEASEAFVNVINKYGGKAKEMWDEAQEIHAKLRT